MKNSELYESVTGIDAKFIDHADSVRNNKTNASAQARGNAARSVIKPRAMGALSAAILAVVFLIAAVTAVTALSLKGRRNSPAGQPAARPTDNSVPEPGQEELPEYALKTPAFPDDSVEIPEELYKGTIKEGVLPLIPMGMELEENYCFEKGGLITLSFAVTHVPNNHLEMEFTELVNVGAPVYRTYEVDGKQCFDVAFYASPDENGSFTVRLVPPADSSADDCVLTHLNSSATAYTANSADNTYVSFASMETAMALAGQKIVQRGTEISSVIRPGTATGDSKRVDLSGTVKYIDDDGELQPADGLIADVYVLTTDHKLLSVTPVAVVNGAYSLSIEADPVKGNVVFTVLRKAKSGKHPADLADITEVDYSSVATVWPGYTIEERFTLAYPEDLLIYEKIRKIY